MASLIQIFEHEKLTLHKNDNALGYCLTESQLARLYDFNDRNNNIYFSGIRNGIKFSKYVGVIQVGDLTIEILPKADKNPNSDHSERIIWRNALLSMLSICNRIKVNSVSEASLNKRYYSLLDLYFDIFLDELNRLLRKGLIKKYHLVSSNTNTLKGRLIFNKNIQQNFIHQERFYTSHQVYDHEHLVNQILLRALNILSLFVSNSAIKDRISRIRLDFPEFSEIEINKTHFDKLTVSRKTNDYNQALQIARMIILNYSPDISKGFENMLALLFDMNKLWEEYIYRMLQRANVPGYHVEFQNSQRFWESKTIRPDIVITKGEGTEKQTFIIDTKWKIVDYRDPSDEDLKQMFAYNIYWSAAKSILLYPQLTKYPEYFGTFHKGSSPENKCKIGFVKVLDDSGKLDYKIGNTIIDKFN